MRRKITKTLTMCLSAMLICGESMPVMQIYAQEIIPIASTAGAVEPTADEAVPSIEPVEALEEVNYPVERLAKATDATTNVLPVEELTESRVSLVGKYDFNDEELFDKLLTEARLIQTGKIYKESLSPGDTSHLYRFTIKDEMLPISVCLKTRSRGIGMQYKCGKYDVGGIEEVHDNREEMMLFYETPFTISTESNNKDETITEYSITNAGDTAFIEIYMVEDYISDYELSIGTSTLGERGIWFSNGTDWWRIGENYARAWDEWVKDDGKWYHFNDKGFMQTGWIKVDGKRYYLNKSGYMKTGWVQDGKKWYYLDKKTGAMKTGWVKDGKKWYYMDKKSGAMKTGWVKDGKKWYYMDKKSGAMKTGWVKDGKKWYYMNGSGEMLASTSRTIKGTTYRFNAKGVCVNP